MQRKGWRQGGVYTGGAADLDAAPDAQAVGDAGEAARRQIDVARAAHAGPDLIAEREAGDFLGSAPALPRNPASEKPKPALRFGK